MATAEKQPCTNQGHPMYNSAEYHVLAKEVDLLPELLQKYQTLLKVQQNQIEFFQDQKFVLVFHTIHSMLTLGLALYECYSFRRFVRNPWGLEAGTPLTNCESRSYAIGCVSMAIAALCMVVSFALTLRRLARILGETADTSSVTDGTNREVWLITAPMIVSFIVMVGAMILRDVLSAHLG